MTHFEFMQKAQRATDAELEILVDTLVEQGAGREEAVDTLAAMRIGGPPVNVSGGFRRGTFVQLRYRSYFDTIRVLPSQLREQRYDFFRDYTYFDANEHKTEAEYNFRRTKRIDANTAFSTRRVCVRAACVDVRLLPAMSISLQVNRIEPPTVWPLVDLNKVWGLPWYAELSDRDDLNVRLFVHDQVEVRCTVHLSIHGWALEEGW